MLEMSWFVACNSKSTMYEMPLMELDYKKQQDTITKFLKSIILFMIIQP